MIIQTFAPFIFPEDEGHFACLLCHRFKCQDIRLTTPVKKSLYVTKAVHGVTGNEIQNRVYELVANLIIRIETIT